MKQGISVLLAICLLVAFAALAEADEGELVALQMEHGLLRDEAGNNYGLGDPAAYEAWRQEEWSKGNATTDVGWAPQCVVNGLAYNYYSGDLFGYLDAEALTEDRYWTTSEDPYYHADEGCDGGKKYPISAQAAEEFEKRACPLCLLAREPLPFVTQEQETPFAPLFACPDGTDLSPYPECYAGSVTSADGELIHRIADDASGNLYAFRDRCDGEYQIAFAKYSLKRLNEALTLARKLLAENDIPATCAIDVPQNLVRITLSDPTEAEQASALPLPLCARIETE